VLQAVWWDNSLQATIPVQDKRFNENQAGGDVDVGKTVGRSAPVISVKVNNSAGSCVVEVYSVIGDQFQAALLDYWSANITMFTRYVVNPNELGAISVRKLFLVDKVVQKYQGPKQVNLNCSYIEQWSPFDRQGIFDGLALSFNLSTADPNWWYKAGYNIPAYPEIDVSTTTGYAAVFNTQMKNFPLLAMIYGTKQLSLCSSPSQCQPYGSYRLNMMDFDTGICILPGIHSGCSGSFKGNGLTPGNVLDWSWKILPVATRDVSGVNFINSLVAQIPGPRFWEPEATYDDETATIVNCLKQNLAKVGMRTDHLKTAPQTDQLGC